MEDSRKYFSSFYGRFGYFVMCFPAAVFSLMFFVVIKEIIDGTYKGSTGFATFISALGAFCFCKLIQCIYQLFKSTPRFLTTNDHLIYKGMFGERKILWDDIKSISLSFAAGPFVYLFLSSRKQRRIYKLDVSGLKPDYNELYGAIKDRINQEDVLGSKWFAWNKSSKEISNKEDAPDRKAVR